MRVNAYWWGVRQSETLAGKPVSFRLVPRSQTEQPRVGQREADASEQLQAEPRREAILQTRNRRLVHARKLLQLHLADQVRLASLAYAFAYALQRISNRWIDRPAHSPIRQQAASPALIRE
jgi:hypothetical protein